MTDIIGTLEQDLTVFATPVETNGTWKGGTATSTTLLTSIQTLMTTLANLQGGIGQAVGTINGDVATALTDAATALNTIADGLASIEQTVPAGSTPAQVLQALQNALTVGQTLLPGSSSALSSVSQFFGMLSSLLTDVGNDITQASTQLYQIAQQLTAIATAF